MSPLENGGDESDGTAAIDETSPLLEREPIPEPRDIADEIAEHPGSVYRQTVLLLIFAVIFMIELGVGMTTAPLNAITEDIICRQVNPQLGTVQRGGALLADDPLCKHPDVQSRLAVIRGWLFVAESIPGCICAIPYGLLADSWGRRPVLALSIFGFIIGTVWYFTVLYFHSIFPLWMILLYPVFTLVGGSTAVTAAVGSTYIADVVPVATRAIAFFELMAVFYVSELVAGPLGGYLMGSDNSHPWTPLAVAFGILVLCNLTTLLLPETLGLREASQTETLPANGTADSAEEGPHKPNFLVTAWRTVSEKAMQVWVFIFSDRSIGLLLLSMGFLIFGRFVAEILLQYTTKRYNWSWQRASFLLSVRTASNLVMFLVVLRLISYFLTTRYNMLPIRRDLLMARVSGVILVLGCLIIAFAVNPPLLFIGLVVMAMGGGIRALVQSLLNSLVEPHHIGVLNGVLGVLNMLGVLVAAATMSETLSLGLRWGGLWIGLPFILAALASLVSTVIIFLYRAPVTPAADILGETVEDDDNNEDTLTT